MFEVRKKKEKSEKGERNVDDGETFTVYDVTPGGLLLFYRVPEDGENPVWIWDDIEKYEPVRDTHD